MTLLLYSVAFAITVGFFLHAKYSRGLNRFNGPFLASFTNAWKVWHIYHLPTQRNDIYVDTHKKYGDVVRIGPNNLSFADPEAIQEIYGTKGSQQKVRIRMVPRCFWVFSRCSPSLCHPYLRAHRVRIVTFLQSEMYDTFSVPVQGNLSTTLLSSLDERWHDQQRRLINSAFNLSSILKYEPWVDDTIDLFQHQIRTRFANKDGQDGIVNLHTWFAFFAADVISNLTYGQRTGFLQAGVDVEGIQSGIRSIFRPWLYV